MVQHPVAVFGIQIVRISRRFLVMIFKVSPKFWQQRNLLSWLLFPVSLLYLLGAKLHKLLYQLRIKKIYRFSMPVIVVGNITVGGTGKTPLVIWLADFFLSKGHKPGIISRGYGGSNQDPVAVTVQSDVSQVGDEALIIVRNTNCPLVVAPNRVAAAQKLIDDFACDLIISDDGLQHYALGRTLEIAVLNGANRYGNGFCLPAGPLRESIARLQKVDFVIVNSGATNINEYAMQIIADKFYRVNNTKVSKSVTEFAKQKVHAVAAIGNPSRFFNFLRSLNLNIIEHPFPDHYRFQTGDCNFTDNLPIIMTEKDAVKCQSFAQDNFWYLKINLELSKELISRLSLSIVLKH